MIILLYHNILAHRPGAFNMLARPDWLTVDEFDQEIASLAERFEFVSLNDIASAVREGRRIPRACAVTFDDGYSGAYKYGLPVLEKYGATGAYFVITRQIGDGGAATYDYFDWLEAQVYLAKADAIDLTDFGMGTMSLTCDACKLALLKRLARVVKTISSSEQSRLNKRLSEQLDSDQERLTAYLSHEVFQPMSWDDVADLRRRSCVVGCHTRTHRALSRLDADELQCEVAGSYDDLRERIGSDAVALAYPFGQAEHYNNEVIDATRSSGFAYALTALNGVNNEQTPLFELRRTTFHGLKKLRQAL